MNFEPPAHHPKAGVTQRVANALGLSYQPDIQDWEYHVVDQASLASCVTAYDTFTPGSDERLVVMELMLLLCEEGDFDLETSPQWVAVRRFLQNEVKLHAYTIWHWASVEEFMESGDNHCDDYRIAPAMRIIYFRHVKPTL